MTYPDDLEFMHSLTAKVTLGTVQEFSTGHFFGRDAMHFARDFIPLL